MRSHVQVWPCSVLVVLLTIGCGGKITGSDHAGDSAPGDDDVTDACPAPRPEICDDSDVCTSDRLSDPGDCTSPCVFTPITACTSGDGCCPLGCKVSVDVDCTSSKEITSFTILGIPGRIGRDFIDIVVPSGTSLASLTPTITHTGFNVSSSSLEAQDFTSYVFYTVTAADRSTKRYVVTVTTALSSGTVHHIDVDVGVDDAGRDGSTGQEWRTLSYAGTRATEPGDIIHVHAGTYEELSSCTLAPGVSVVGDGQDLSILTSAVSTSGHAIITADSDLPGSEGNHTFADLTFDGNDETVSYGIHVRRRSHIQIHDCTFVDFALSAVSIFGGSSTTAEPVPYATGCSIHDCTFFNASGCPGNTDSWSSAGAISMGGLDGMTIYNNTIIQPAEAVLRGLPIKGVSGWHKGLKIYNNTIHKLSSSRDLPFAVELWVVRGGCDIFRNDVIGDIDLVNVSTGLYDYGARVFENSLGPSELGSLLYPGLSLESNIDEVDVYQNHFKNMSNGVVLSSGEGYASDDPQTYRPFTKTDIRIRYNLFENIGTSNDEPYQRVIQFSATDYDHVFDRFEVYNNVIVGKVGGTTASGVWLPEHGAASNFFIKNNIVMNMSVTPVWGRGTDCPMDGLQIDSNIFFGNGGSNAPLFDYGFDSVMTDYTIANTIELDPLFVGGLPYSFAPAPGSPAINAGVDVGLVVDFAEQPIVGAPDIGAYEYQP